jgi:hypothetical protein
MLSFKGLEDAIAILDKARIEFEKLGYTVETNKRLALNECNRPFINDEVIEFKLSAIRIPLADVLRAEKAENAVG